MPGQITTWRKNTAVHNLYLPGVLTYDTGAWEKAEVSLLCRQRNPRPVSLKESCHYAVGRIDTKMIFINSLMPELNPSAQRCLTRFVTGNFASWTVHFVNICVKNQQMQQLFIQFINYLWYLLHVSALHCHLQGAFLVPSERCSIEEQSIEYCGWVCCV
jgi:hypothetical protein